MVGEIISVPVTALATLIAAKNGSPEAAMVAAAGAELTSVVASRLATEFSSMRGRRIRKVLLGTAHDVNTSADELVARLLGDEELAQILYDVLQLAAETASERKIGQLRDVLRRVVTSRASINEEQIFLRVIGQIDDVHAEALNLIQTQNDNATTDEHNDVIPYTTAEMSQDLGLQSAVGSAVVMTLTGVGCVYTSDIRMRQGLGQMLSDPQDFGLWMTAFGRYLLTRLA